MKRMLPVGMRKAQEPIMIGNAALGFMPSRLTRIMHGAYRPMPSVIKAPSMKFTATAITSLMPVTPSASPPPGKSFIWVMNINPAAASKATPIPTCTFRLGQRATTPAPSQAPRIEAPIIEKRVGTSTGMIVV